MTLYAFNGFEPSLPNNGAYWVAPNAQVMGRVTLEEDASIWFGCVLRGDNDPIHIGARSNIQDNSVLHTDDGVPLTIGQDVTVGHMVMLHGCTIGNNTLIGIGSIVLNGAVCGKKWLIGANTLIPEGKIIPDNSMVLGSPGKVVKDVSTEMLEMLSMLSRVYVDNYKRFKEGLREISE